jgi:diguanylate cyclase (GGDEF)-like protein
VILDPARQSLPSTAATIIRQTKIRICLALVAGVVAVIFLWSKTSPGLTVGIVAAVAGYLSLVGTLYAVARYARETPSATIAAMLIGDLFFIFAATILTSRPPYYDRALILSFFVLHLTELYLGRVYALLITGLVASSYVLLVAVSIHGGTALGWGEELWSVGAFVVGAVVFTQQRGAVRRRAGRIVALFERAEEGDFSEEYDVASDREPDAITAIGQAYNRVRTRLESMVLTDPLTGCLNRRGFDQALAREIARSTRAGGEFTLLAIDLDHFKRLNDRCGHLAGDAILRELGALLQQTARAGDIVARTGGEEFTLILPETNATGGFQLATRLCERIRKREFVVAGRPLRITVSVGVAAAPGDQGQELKLRADQALYAAKRLGRDRVLTWNE